MNVWHGAAREVPGIHWRSRTAARRPASATATISIRRHAIERIGALLSAAGSRLWPRGRDPDRVEPDPEAGRRRHRPTAQPTGDQGAGVRGGAELWEGRLTRPSGSRLRHRQLTGPLVIGPVSPRHNPVSTLRCVSSHATRGRSR